MSSQISPASMIAAGLLASVEELGPRRPAGYRRTLRELLARGY